LERLRLLLVPRLTAVLIVVVILMLLVSIVSHRLGIETGLSIALFPMVIIAMAIERMSVMWEERGAGDAIKAGVGTLIVASLSYFVMGIDLLEHLFLTFPELLLVILAVVLVIGRYTGYRLTELTRFRALES
ncbi:MAG: 7TM domain-containing protein, partial [Pseudomonadota bacterium]